MAHDIVLLLTPHETRNVKDALTKYQNWIFGSDDPGTPQDQRAVERILTRIAEQEAKVPEVYVPRARRPRQPSPKCDNPDCGHAFRSHNELGYCRAKRPSAAACKRLRAQGRAIPDGCDCGY